MSVYRFLFNLNFWKWLRFTVSVLQFIFTDRLFKLYWSHTGCPGHSSDKILACFLLLLLLQLMISIIADSDTAIHFFPIWNCKCNLESIFKHEVFSRKGPLIAFKDKNWICWHFPGFLRHLIAAYFPAIHSHGSTSIPSLRVTYYCSIARQRCHSIQQLLPSPDPSISRESSDKHPGLQSYHHTQHATPQSYYNI